WPFRLLSGCGFLLSLLSFSYGLFVIIKHLMYGDPVQGWTTLITVVLFFAGVQLISVGVLGEYIARIFGEVKNRPVYLVRRRDGVGVSAGQRRAAQAAGGRVSPLRSTRRTAVNVVNE